MKFTMTLLGLLLSWLVRHALCRRYSSYCCPASERCEEVGSTSTRITRQPKVPNHGALIEKTSLAPWNYTYDRNDNRTPQTIRNATCSDCMVKGLKAVPIQYEIDVIYRKICGNKTVICKCPCTVNVGCTCVKENKCHRISASCLPE